MYNTDLRWRVIYLKYQWRYSKTQISRLLAIHRSTVKRIIKKCLDTGDVQCLKVGRPRRSSFHLHEQFVLVDAALNNPSLCLKELMWEIRNSTGAEYCLSTFQRNLKRLSFSFKMLRKVALQQSKHLRAEFRATILQYDPEMLLFLDETGFDKRLVRRWEYSFKGTRACIKRYLAWGPRVSAIAVMGATDIQCVSTFRGSVDGAKFVQFLRDDLVPILEPFNGINHNSVVVMDNAAIHHIPEVRDIIEDTGALLIYLPPYSPDYNPLEELFSKVKYQIRQNDIVFQATDDPEALILESFYHVTSEDCNGYFRNAEYI